ncbi:PREDICTED: probable fatty acid-binding protein [Rhagoletis zephyria]|uniref:probable fatty acid-binding protein n=1 Tax=Rhagoletis zephyria TaxID=28612 RepID=UPI000811A0B6|nr:PREDICTED: probable fatty acid-binding protein [Rhagoletis zephyria]
MIKKINCWEGKQYKLVSSDNYDAYLKELGMGLVQRKMGNSQQPIVLLHKIESTHNLITLANVEQEPTILTFKLDKAFDEETYDLRKVSNVLHMFDNTLVQEQKGIVTARITREFHHTKMIETLVANKVVAVRVFRALEEDEMEDMSKVIGKLEADERQRQADGEENSRSKRKLEKKEH